MPIPDFQTLMLPLLRFAADGKEHTMQEAREVLAREFKLSEKELHELLPSGKQSIFTNRVAWAKSYLIQAGLLDASKKGILAITERGREILKEQPSRLNIKYLERFSEFKNSPRCAARCCLIHRQRGSFVMFLPTRTAAPHRGLPIISTELGSARAHNQ